MTEKPLQKLARGSYYLLLDNVTNVALGAIFWIILAKMIEPSSIGQTMVVIAFAMSVIGFAGFGVQVTISKYISEYNARKMPNAARRVLKLGLTMALGVGGSFGIAIALLSSTIADVTYQDPALAVLLTFAVLTFLPAHTVVAALLGAFQGAQKMKYTVLTDLIYQIIRLTIAVTLVLYGLDSFGILVAFAAASVVASTIGYVVLIPRAVPKSVNQKEEGHGLQQILKFSGFNYFAIGMRTLSAQIGVIVLGTQNFEWAAFFGLSVLISNMVGGVMLAVSKAMLPTASEEWVKGKKEQFKDVFSTGIRLSLMISGFALIVLMIEPSYVLRLISESYVEASTALRILVLATIISSVGVVMISILNAANRPRDVAKIGIISYGSTIILTFVLTPVMGLVGAAIAMMIGALSLTSLSMVVLKTKEQFLPSSKSLIRPSLALLLALAIGYSLLAILSEPLIAIVMAILSYVGLVKITGVTTGRELKSLFAMLKRGS